MSDEFQMDAVDKLAAQLFVQRLGAWVVTGRQDRIRDNEISAAAENAYQEADAFIKVSLERRKR
jgi:fructose-1,6-bisphosphatase/inositol monophosphatase family enzyme